ncbi:MAG: hypothetical protein ABIT47_04585 [Candidatus Paceibacterota bacterium]
MEDMITQNEYTQKPAVKTRRQNPIQTLGVKARRRPILSILLIVAVLGIAGTAYYYHQYQVLKKNPNAAQEAEVAQLVGEVSTLILLPNETPTVATVLDTKALTDQPFFAKALNGDKVLVFVNAKEAILYRPSAHKLINVAPLYFQDTNTNQSTAAAVQTPITEPAPVKATDTSTTKTTTKTASSSTSN